MLSALYPFNDQYESRLDDTDDPFCHRHEDQKLGR